MAGTPPGLSPDTYVNASTAGAARLAALGIGLIAPGETVVFVAAASRHRRDAFLAADQMMDYLKASAPFWKKSHEADGAKWVEPREQDYIDASRWDRP